MRYSLKRKQTSDAVASLQKIQYGGLTVKVCGQIKKIKKETPPKIKS